MSNAVNGSRIIMKFNGLVITCQTECSFTTDQELLPASPLTEGGWKDYIEGARGWAMSVSGKFLMQAAGADFKNVLSAIMKRTPVFLEFTTNTGEAQEFVISGYAKPQNVGINAASVGKAGWTANFLGSQSFKMTELDYGLIINAMPIEAAYPLIVNTTL